MRMPQSYLIFFAGYFDNKKLKSPNCISALLVFYISHVCSPLVYQSFIYVFVRKKKAIWAGVLPSGTFCNGAWMRS
jgi:hypothetical protein